MVVLGVANLAVKFALELATLAAFAYWGGTVGAGAVPLLVGIAAPFLTVALWGRFAAPRARRRLPLRLRAR